MAGPIYKLWMTRYKEPWFQLSEEEQKGYIAKLIEIREEVGGKEVITCDPFWSDHTWTVFGVDEYPDIEAAQKCAQLLNELQYARYVEASSMLGTTYEMP
jgi:hypothetical protein